MHILGKVFAFLVILLGIGAFILTTQMLDFRQSWLKQVDANQKTLVTAKKATADKRKELANLQAELDRIMLGWDTYTSNVQAQGDPATGTLQLNVGLGTPGLVETKDKDGKPVLPVVYAFQPAADMKSMEYVGEFRVEQLAQGQSALKANWRVRPTDSAMWKLGPNWRIRTRIPTAQKVKFDQFSIMFADIDERISYETNELARSRNEFAKKIKLALANRENELQGFESLQPNRGKIDDEMIDGVLATLVKEDEARNAALVQANELRHELNETVENFERLNSDNTKAAKAMPKGAAPKTAAKQ
jgi:hypothetical protein